jgi:hypothetical protein
VCLQREMIEADDKLKRLYRLVEDGLTDLDEVLQDRLHTLKAERDRAKAALERAKEYSVSHIRIDPALIERFGRTMREKFSTGSVPFRKAYLRSLIDAVEVDDHQIRIKGNKELLEKAVLATQSGQSWCSQTSTRWRTQRDSSFLPPRLVVCDKVIDLAAPVSNSATRRSPSCLQICAIGGAWPPSSCSASIRKSPYCSQSKKIFLLVSFLADLTDRRPGAS